MIPLQINYEGEVWNYVFSDPDGCLSESDRKVLVWDAVDVYRTNRRRKSVRGDDFEGELRDTKQEGRLGSFFGRLIEGFIETDKGKNNVGLILWSYAPVEWN